VKQQQQLSKLKPEAAATTTTTHSHQQGNICPTHTHSPAKKERVLERECGNMEDLFLLIIKESTGTKHNALRQTAQIAYGKLSFLFAICVNLPLARRK